MRWFVAVVLAVLVAHAGARAQQPDALDAGDAGDSAEDASADAASDGGDAEVSVDSGADAGRSATLPSETHDAGTAQDAAFPSDASTADVSVEPAPIAPSAPPAATPPTSPFANTSQAVRIVLALLALLVLTWFVGHPRMRALEHRLGISQAIAAGFPFVALGLAASHPDVGILTSDVLEEFAPVLQLGLGCIGFYTGFQLDMRAVEKLPLGTTPVVSLLVGVPFAVVSFAVLVALDATGVDAGDIRDLTDTRYLRDAVILGTAAAMSAPRLLALTSRAPVESAPSMHPEALDDLAGVVCLALLGAYSRGDVQDVAWSIPSTAWLFVMLGLGVAVGLVIYVIMRRPATEPESLVLTLGSIAFAAGLAAHLALPPIVVCFVAGALLGNLPGTYKPRLGATLERLERPIHLLFLVVAGALWSDAGDWRGWMLVPLFALGRFGGRFIALRAARRAGPDARAQAESMRVVAPLSPLAIALVVSVDRLIVHTSIPWLTTAVIGGALVTEVVVQLATPRPARKLEVR